MRAIWGLVVAGAVFGAQPAAAQSCPPEAVTVYFGFDSDVITPEAAAVLDRAAKAYAACPASEVEISGHTDRFGDSAYNVGLSQRMASNVRAYLAGRGVPDRAMTTEAFGETRPIVATADGVREPQNRRVGIAFGAESGW